ncbi:MAG: glycosyltransferase [Nitrososphaerota archaeon]|nr:glycosyltransferase [Nitrososphaerota archaeon]
MSVIGSSVRSGLRTKAVIKQEELLARTGDSWRNRGARETLPNGITVGMITKDSHSQLGERFTQVLERIHSEVPYVRFILVDSSRDETPEVARSALPEMVVIRGEGNRAQARQLAIDSTTSEWLLFVDDDCLISHGWFERALPQMSNPEVGMVWGEEIGRLRPNRFANDDTKSAFLRMGGTQDTLIRMGAVRNIRIPQFLHWREDTWIRDYIVGRGYRVVSLAEGYLHLKTYDECTLEKLRTEPREMFSCERFVRVFKPNLKYASARLLNVIGAPQHTRRWIGWFRYFAGLYAYHPWPRPSLNRKVVPALVYLNQVYVPVWSHFKKFLRVWLAVLANDVGQIGHDTFVVRKKGQTLVMKGEHLTMMLDEAKMWSEAYLPPAGVKGKTVLDVGAGCGETAFFYLNHGARAVVAIEPDHEAAQMLRENARVNRWNVQVIERPFKNEYLETPHDFLKMDGEGCESELLTYGGLLGDCVIECHSLELRNELSSKFNLHLSRIPEKAKGNVVILTSSSRSNF